MLIFQSTGVILLSSLTTCSTYARRHGEPTCACVRAHARAYENMKQKEKKKKSTTAADALRPPDRACT